VGCTLGNVVGVSVDAGLGSLDGTNDGAELGNVVQPSEMQTMVQW
jgi:hypothetical protein